MIKIDRNIPIPTSRNYDRYAFDRFEIGDSAAYPPGTNRLRAAIVCYAKRHNRKFITRTVTENGQKVVRVWRIK